MRPKMAFLSLYVLSGFLIACASRHTPTTAPVQPTPPPLTPTTMVIPDISEKDAPMTDESTPQSPSPPPAATGGSMAGPPVQETSQAALDLFIPTTVQGDLDRSDDPIIVRARFVDINFDLLTRAEGPPGSQFSGGDVLRLNLFEDTSFTAVLDRVESRPPNAFTWVGHIEGVAHSQVTLAVEDEVMSGNITLPKTFYQVRYAGNGVHAIYQIDQSAFPSEEEPPLPVSPSQG